jgi:ABC-type branched-subunit amino acid transport system substrate-binding protein
MHTKIYVTRSLTALCTFSLILFARFLAVAQDNQARVFRVGAIVPLTGPVADYGVAVKNGFELAKSDHPATFKNVEIVYQDSSYDGKTAVNAFNALFARGDINLYYVWGVTPNETLLPILAARSLPVISETTIKASIVGKPLAVRAAPTGEMTARELTSHFVKQGYRSIGVLMVDIPYYRDIYEALKFQLASTGVQLDLIDTFATDASDFKTVIARIRSKSYGAIGVFLLNDQVVTYYRQAFALKFGTPTFGASIHDSQELITRAGPGAEGAFFVGHDVVPNFRDRWLSLFKDDARVGNGANAFDTAVMIGELFGDGRSSKLSASEVVARFASITKRNGVSGAFGYVETQDAGKHFDLPLSAKVVRQGRIEPAVVTP